VHCGIAGFSRLHTADSHTQFQLRNAAGSAAAASRGGQHLSGSGPYAAMRGVPRGGLCKGLPLDATLSHAPASRSVLSMLDGSSRSCGAAIGRTLSRACNNAALSTEAVAPGLRPLTVQVSLCGAADAADRRARRQCLGHRGNVAVCGAHAPCPH